MVRKAARGAPTAGQQRGFAFIAALFLLVVLGAFAAFIVSIGANSQASSAMAIQGVRSYEAANAGLEWAAYQELDPRQAIWGAITTPPDCFPAGASPTLPAAFGGFTLTVTCTRYPPNPANYYEEGGQRVAIYLFTATATLGTPGTASYVERQLEARVENCKNPYGLAPSYACS